MQSYDPSKAPQLDTDACAEARTLGLQPIHIICNEPGAKVGDHTGVSFLTFAAFLPRVGDRIELEDGTLCEVKRTYFKLARTAAGAKLSMIVANVAAVRIGKT